MVLSTLKYSHQHEHSPQKVSLHESQTNCSPEKIQCVKANKCLWFPYAVAFLVDSSFVLTMFCGVKFSNGMKF